MIVGSFLKLPAEVKDYSIDWSGVLDTGDTISTSTWTISPTTSPPLSEDSESEDTDSTTIWLSGGEVGSVYVLTNTIVTTNGREIQQGLQIRVTYLELGVTAFSDLETVDAYLSLVGDATWMALTPTEREQYILRASRLLNRLNWRGSKTSSTQSLAWPRSGITGVEDDEYPQNLKDATAELAALLAAGTTTFETEATSEQKLRRIKAGSVELEYFRDADGRPRRLPLAAHELLRDYLQGTTPTVSGVATGTGGTSSTEDDFGHSGPL